MCIRLCLGTCEHRYSQNPEVGFPVAGVSGDCELTEVSAEDRIHILWKRSSTSGPLSHFSSFLNNIFKEKRIDFYSFTKQSLDI